MSETPSTKLSGFDFWRTTLRAAQFVVAPMVDQSELAWRMLSRRYGAELCYTPMLHASVFIRDARYRREAMATCTEDRPLIVQFCANDPETLLTAARLVEDSCDAVDLNLGCPQSIAKRGHYGAFLQDEWDLLHSMVSHCSTNLRVPITCKLRIFEDVEKSIRYAEMLVRAGAQLLCVHGRTREQKGPVTGLADWNQITAIRKRVNVPIFANGNIQYLEDVHRCLAETGAQGVMTAESNLHNPALFTGQELPAWQLSEEYLQLVEQYPCPKSFIRAHLFKLLHHILLIHTKYRDILSLCKTLSNFKQLVEQVKEVCQVDVKAYEAGKVFVPSPNQHLPYWLCQPYIRPDPEDPMSAERRLIRESSKRPLEIVQLADDQPVLSKNKLKKLRRNGNKNFLPNPDKFAKCTCGNPKLCFNHSLIRDGFVYNIWSSDIFGNPEGLACISDQCRSCCRARAYKNSLNCPGHRLTFATKVKKSSEATATSGTTCISSDLRPTDPEHNVDAASREVLLNTGEDVIEEGPTVIEDICDTDNATNIEIFDANSKSDVVSEDERIAKDS